MMFLAMIMALSLQQVLQPGNVLQRDGWLFSWHGLVAKYAPGETLRVVITLSGIALLAYWALSSLQGWMFGLLELLLTAGFFVWSLGRDDFHTALERYEAKIADDPIAAQKALDALWAPDGTGNTDKSDNAQASTPSSTPPSTPPSTHPRDFQRLVYSGYARWFAPLFYFAVGGPLAALLYRAVSELARDNPDSLYLRLLHWLDWVPARLLGLSFALSGDFMAVSQRTSLALILDSTSAAQLLTELASVACNNAPGARVLGDILYRSAGLWLLVLSGVLILG
ncbi:MAG: regulatory signaling modulator protein AmpE [Congregibacter sp.]|nr:regulatory signaling modulator protein AmpE [Congregibacter sp.]